MSAEVPQAETVAVPEKLPAVQRVRRSVMPRLRRGLNRVDNPEVKAARTLVTSRRRNPTDVVHFGASESLFVSPADTDTRVLPAMLADALAPELTIFSAVGPGYHPRLLSEYVRLMSGLAAPRVVVVGIPVRVGYRPWARHPLYSYGPAVRALTAMRPTTHPLLLRRPLPVPTGAQMAEFDQVTYTTVAGSSPIGDLRRQLKNPVAAGLTRDEAARLLWAYHHGALDGLDEPWLAGVTALGRALTGLGSSVVLYHPPIPVEHGVELFGARVREANQTNLDLIHERMRAACPEVSIVDSALSFVDADFIDLDDASEHLNDIGRSKLSALIVEHVRRVTT